MNILHHKSWHVRNKDNIERVRRDEEQAAEEERQKQKRIALAEQEARTELLRNKVKQKQLKTSDQDRLQPVDASVSDEKYRTHINFFHAEEEGQKQGTNLDYEAEKKQEKEKYEKGIGLLTYLGQSSVESQQSTPWYFKAHDRRHASGDAECYNHSKQEYDHKRKLDQDPMKHMTKYLKTKRKYEDITKDETIGKHKHKHKNDKKNTTVSPASSCGKKSIEVLRAERLKRERAERKRAEEMLSKSRGEKIHEKEIAIDERDRRYNTQFNPEFVRKPRNKPMYK